MPYVVRTEDCHYQCRHGYINIKLPVALATRADMNSDIPLETSAIFFFLAKLFLKLGISSEYNYHGLFHLHGLARPVSSANQELQNEKFEHLKVDRVLPKCAIKVTCTACHMVDVVNFFVVYYILSSLYSKQTSLLVKQQNYTNTL